MRTTKKLIVGSPEAMKYEPPIDPPEPCPTKRKFINKLCNWHVLVKDKELDIHPEMEDNPQYPPRLFTNDSKGG
tara:strand:- start:2 stop:223 length:222 start_codon:yes stop_codon:yes gene_type:complete